MENLIIHGLQNNISFCEAQGIANCFQTYANECSNEEILSIGFNCNSGYTFIALENGITICSMLGRECEYLVIDFNNGEETIFETYEQAKEFLQAL